MSKPALVATDLSVVAHNEQRSFAIDLERWQNLAQQALCDLGQQQGELSLLFVDQTEMAQLNHRHLGNNYATDVLAFPIDGVDEESPNEILIGDVVVCPAIAAQQAANHRHPHDGSLADELALLIVHGVLHILGYDHYDRASTKAMQAQEQRILNKYYWS